MALAKTILLAVCAQSMTGLGCQSTTTATESAAESVRAANARVVEALQRHNVDAAMALYTEDAILQLPGMPPLSGKSAIRTFYAAGSDTSTIFEATPAKIEVASSGELAYLLGAKREVCKLAGRQVASEGKVLIVWKKVKSDWLIQAISASNNSPTTRGCL
jgi:uncharacterized protein (TIGR02246 family)